VTDPLPLFPLGTVLFPGVAIPLHIFEDRYRVLLRDLMALPADQAREFGIVAIKVGYEVGGHGANTVHTVGCSAVITDITAHADGTFDVVARGNRRLRVDSLDARGDYLRSQVNWLPDEPGDDLATATVAAAAAFDTYRQRVAEIRGEDVLLGDLPSDPTTMSYAISAALILSLADRQQLLETEDVSSRLKLATSLIYAEMRAMAAVTSLPATEMARTSWSPN
jgi:Lon protease-like protein